MRKKPGFTFIEVIVVLAIFSIIILSTYGVFRSASMVWRRSRELPLDERRVMLALERLAGQLRAYCAKIGLDKEEWRFIGSPRSLSFVAFCADGLCLYEYEFNPLSGKLVFTENMVDKEDGELEKIRQRELIEGADGLSFRFLGYDRQLKEYFWYEEWEEEKKEAPFAVEAKITCEDETYSRKIFILQ
ncbi:type II secretion system protein J [Candidatus Omnitrophota bacterium]